LQSVATQASVLSMIVTLFWQCTMHYTAITYKWLVQLQWVLLQEYWNPWI